MTDRTASEHTPGPWRIEEYGDDDAPALVIHKDGETRICFMATPGSRGDPAKIAADARLIAAAPDMKAENEHLRSVNADMLAVLGKAFIAMRIAKAIPAIAAEYDFDEAIDAASDILAKARSAA